MPSDQICSEALCLYSMCGTRESSGLYRQGFGGVEVLQ